jgi:glycosyltransferase involved in cell wall biosynthesis
MKVLLAAHFDSVHSRRYAELISMAGCEVVLLEKGNLPQLPGGLTRRYYRWPRAGRSILRYFVGRRLAEKIGRAVVELQLKLLWMRINPDICHVQWIDDKARVLTRIGLCPVVLTAWGTDIRMTEDKSCDSVLRWCKSDAVSNAALFTADSDEIIAIATALAQHSLPTKLIPLGIDTTVFRPDLQVERARWRNELGIPSTATVALSPRGFQARYGHHTIVGAFSRAVAKTETDAYLVFKRFNSDNPRYLNEVNAIAARLGVQNRIRMLDEVPYDGLPGYYAMGDFAINFPEADAFPVTFMECLACEVPILTKHLPAYDSFGIRPYLRFADAPTEQALEKAISTMFSEHHSMREQMAEARSFACANFDEAVVARSLFQEYQKVLAGKSLHGRTVK